MGTKVVPHSAATIKAQIKSAPLLWYCYHQMYACRMTDDGSSMGRNVLATWQSWIGQLSLLYVYPYLWDLVKVLVPLRSMMHDLELRGDGPFRLFRRDQPRYSGDQAPFHDSSTHSLNHRDVLIVIPLSMSVLWLCGQLDVTTNLETSRRYSEH